MLSYFIV